MKAMYDKKRKIIFDEDKENDIIWMSWGKPESSVEIGSKKTPLIIFDIDKKGRIVGLEILNWSVGI